MTLTRKNHSAWRQTGPSATFSNTDLTWTGPGTNPGLPIETNKIKCTDNQEITIFMEAEI